jgi:hypothetical protein
MGPKKNNNGEEEDRSCEKFFALYKKNCQAIDQPMCKIVKEAYDTIYLGEETNLTKVSLFIFKKVIVV